MYAVIETGGKQYRVTPGQTIEVERLGVSDGDVVELDRVLLVADGDKITVGNPVIAGAKVVASRREEIKGKKVIVFKYKPKTRYRKKTGHRQPYTRLTIDKIIGAGVSKGEPAGKARRRKKEVPSIGE